MSRVFRTIISNQPTLKNDKKKLSNKKIFYDQMSELNENELLTGDVGVVFDVYSATKKPDLDELVILDLLEEKAFKSTRQVKVKLVRHHIDKKNPRTCIQVFKLNESLKNWWDEIEIMSEETN
tara:strand:- start:1001 stop:1369 length:369 start_codon:yes stop_codon:yes gene_type:complete